MEAAVTPGTVYWVRCVLERQKGIGGKPAGRLSNSQSAVKLLEFIRNTDREHIVTISLSTKNEPLAISVEAIGSTNSVKSGPAELFRVPILAGAVGIIIGHNHPSGDPSPSSADRLYTQDVAASAKLLGIRLIDHIIVAPGSAYYSFLDEGALP